MPDNEEWFQTIAEFAPVAIAVIDAAGSARYVNRRLAEIARRPRESLLGPGPTSFLAADGPLLARLRDPEEAVALHWMTDTAKRPIGAVAVIDDIADRFDSLARTAAGIAHEFEDTLTDLLTSNPAPSAVVPGPAPAGFDVNSLIRSTVPPIVAQAPSATLSLLLAEPPATVRMDPAQLAEALRFLTANAIEAMPDGGEITVVASGTANRRGGEFCQVSVMDNGVGMTAESLEHAVEPFCTTKVGTPWAGLGLTASNGIVRRAGGRMTVTSAPGAGTTVHLHVPAHAAAERALLLIVDDDEALRAIAGRSLTRAGFEVLTATSGIEALSVIRGRTFDCLVTDIAMPDMGGIDLAEQARGVDPEMPIVFVSGFVSVAPVGGPLPDHTHTLTKPYTAEALTSAVRRAIRRRQVTMSGG